MLYLEHWKSLFFKKKMKIVIGRGWYYQDLKDKDFLVDSSFGLYFALCNRLVLSKLLVSSTVTVVLRVKTCLDAVLLWELNRSVMTILNLSSFDLKGFVFFYKR
uniref:Uncharacterized protein n=1 Tax=Kangiella spongicola TaxID=796379 RepID=A0A318CZB5_9GAMM